MTRRRGGFSLVELLVAVAILGLSISVVAVTAGMARRWAPVASPHEEARATSIVQASTQTAFPDSLAPTEPVTFLPDGRAVGAGVDPLMGARLR